MHGSTFTGDGEKARLDMGVVMDAIAAWAVRINGRNG
jgi:hypothetical protein